MSPTTIGIRRSSVLVTGASGFIGSHIVKALITKNYTVTGVIRRNNPPNELLQVSEDILRFIRTDISDPGADLRSLCEGQDFVIHAAAKAGDWGSYSEFKRINVESTKRLLVEAQVAGVHKLVYISSLAVHGFGNHIATTENGPYYPLINPYQITKLEAEKAVTKAASTHFLTTVIRPGNVYGPGDTTTFFPIFDALRRGIMGFIGNGNTLTCPVYVSDIVDAIILALEKKESNGEIFNIVSRDVVTWRELLNYAAKLLYVPAPRVMLPAGLASATASILESLYKLGKIPSAPPITHYRVDQLTDNYHFSFKKAFDELDYNPRYKIEEGFPLTVDDYLSQMG